MGTDVPFASEQCGVACLLQYFAKSGYIRAQMVAIVGVAQVALEESHAGIVLILARDERSTCGCTDGVVVELAEAYPFVGQTVDVRSVKVGGSIAAEVREPKVVDHDEDNVWPVVILCFGVSGGQQSERCQSQLWGQVAG